MKKSSWKYWVILAGSLSVIVVFQNCQPTPSRSLSSDASVMTPTNEADFQTPSETQ